jgi:hypothetical protein
MLNNESQSSTHAFKQDDDPLGCIGCRETNKGEAWELGVSRVVLCRSPVFFLHNGAVLVSDATSSSLAPGPASVLAWYRLI